MLRHEELLERLNYNPATGIFTWRTSKGNTVVGEQAGYIADRGYKKISLKGKLYRASRLAWYYTHGAWPNVIDHINGNKLDDRIANLRDIDQAANLRNKKYAAGITGYRGVRLTKAGTYSARARKGKTEIHLGTYKTAKDAYTAVYNKAMELGYTERHYPNPNKIEGSIINGN